MRVALLLLGLLRGALLAQAIRRRTVYTDTAMNFLRQYGHHYGLFDMFFNSTKGDPRLSHPLQSLDSDISDSYLVHDHSKYESWYMSSADRHKYSDFDAYEGHNKDQNVFRYGPHPMDRFLNVFVTGDLEVSNTLREPRIFMLGYEIGFHKRYEQLECEFTYPVQATRTAQISGDILTALNQPTDENIVYCPIPEEVLAGLNELDEATYLTLDLHVIGNKATGNATERFSLRNVKVKLPDPLEQRKFNMTMICSVDNTEDVLLVEYLVYHILIGVEHFYIYDNSKRTLDTATSMLRPFIDANIVTLHFWPFRGLKGETYAVSQRGAMNSFLFMFGPYSRWTAMNDMDEFFLPAVKFLPQAVTNQTVHFSLPGNRKLNQEDHLSIAVKALDFIGGKEIIPVVGFDSLESDCPEEWVGLNEYVGGAHSNGMIHERELHPNMTVREIQIMLHLFPRVAVTTYCRRTGALFVESKVSHGKIIIKPTHPVVTYLTTPHRWNTWWWEITNKDTGGVFRHFSGGMRNSKKLGIFPGVWDGTFVLDDHLRDLTLSMLQNINVYWK